MHAVTITEFCIPLWTMREPLGLSLDLLNLQVGAMGSREGRLGTQAFQ